MGTGRGPVDTSLTGIDRASSAFRPVPVRCPPVPMPVGLLVVGKGGAPPEVAHLTADRGPLTRRGWSPGLGRHVPARSTEPDGRQAPRAIFVGRRCPVIRKREIPGSVPFDGDGPGDLVIRRPRLSSRPGRDLASPAHGGQHPGGCVRSGPPPVRTHSFRPILRRAPGRLGHVPRRLGQPDNARRWPSLRLPWRHGPGRAPPPDGRRARCSRLGRHRGAATPTSPRRGLEVVGRRS